MKQMSLLDSFIKKAKQKQCSLSSQKNNGEDNSIDNQSKEKICSTSTDFNISQTVSHKDQKQNKNGNKMQIEINSDSEESLKHLKKKSNAKKSKQQKQDKNSVQFQSVKDDLSDLDIDSFSDSESFQQNRKKKKSSRKVKITNKKNVQSDYKKKVKDQNNEQRKQQQSGIIAEQTNAFDRSQFTDSTPNWAIPGHPTCLDKNGNNCTSPDYDETTLQVPQLFLKTITAPMRQYWLIKAENFEKIVLFKLGKFYELFYEDALLGNRYLELKWMGSKMHTGFPEKTLQRYTNELIKFGFKVVVVEQMETVSQMQERIKQDRANGRKSQKTLNRAVTQICTRGTQIPSEEQNYLPNYLISVYRHEQYLAYSLLDMGANTVLMGIVDSFEEFKTVLYQTRPSQFLFDPDNMPFKYIEILRENMPQMILSKLQNKQNIWHYLSAKNEMAQLDQTKVLKRPKIMDTLDQFQFIPRSLIMSTLSGLFEYLHKIFKFEYVVPSLKFRFYQKDKASTHLILDSQALQHLEIFETSQGQKGSLFDKVQRTKTAFGKRLFRKWMVSPLIDPYKINQRLDAIGDISVLASQRQEIGRQLSKLPDLERLANKLSKYAIKNTSASQAVYFEDLPTIRLKQFDQFMLSLQRSLKIIAILEGHISEYKSKRLKSLITMGNGEQVNHEKLIFFEDEEDESSDLQIKGLMPDILTNLGTFKEFVVWKDGKPFPKPGLVEEYDRLEKQQSQIKKQLNMILEKIRQHFKCPQINYVNIKQDYQVEIPEKKSIKIPKSFIFSSKRAGFSRYLVPEVRQTVSKLQEVEKVLKVQMNMFVTFFFQKFKEKQNVWERYINIVAELDCLVGMSQYSLKNSGCRPVFIEKGYEVQEGYHPSLASNNFIPNDISFAQPVMILTGPNMGGKSTTLRTTCLLTILAQMGSYVPAKSYRAQIIDRIFTRIGASDKLQAGKSTFFIEMEETQSIMKYATSRSLAIMDQLGRGTATFDGMAIAHSVLTHIIEKIGCKCMFATHYHSLTEQFSGVKNTCLKMMDYRLIQDKEDRIRFLYKLVDGKAEKSFGLNVAQMVGHPAVLIEQARAKADQMHQQIQQCKVKAKILELARVLGRDLTNSSSLN